jgi:hypothetical protein
MVPGWTWAKTVTAPCDLIKAAIKCAAAVASPCFWYGVPTTHATSAVKTPFSQLIVACVVPTAWPSSRRRMTQLSQRCDLPAGADNKRR